MIKVTRTMKRRHKSLYSNKGRISYYVVVINLTIKIMSVCRLNSLGPQDYSVSGGHQFAQFPLGGVCLYKN